jgi:hypothetical protein
MLTIHNRNKIVNHTITAEWYVEDIREMHSHNLQTKQIQTLYSITIRNRTTKYFEDINLYRDKTKREIGEWYELKCIRKGKTHTHYLTKEGIQNIKVLLHHIKNVGID